MESIYWTLLGDLTNFQPKKDYDGQVTVIKSIVKEKSSICIKPVTFESWC